MYQGWVYLGVARDKYMESLRKRIASLKEVEKEIGSDARKEHIQYILGAMIGYFDEKCIEVDKQYTVSDSQLDSRILFAETVFTDIKESRFDELSSRINDLVLNKQYRCGFISNRFHNILVEYQVRSSIVKVIANLQVCLDQAIGGHVKSLLLSIKGLLDEKLSTEEGCVAKILNYPQLRWQLKVTKVFCCYVKDDAELKFQVGLALGKSRFSSSFFRRACPFREILIRFLSASDTGARSTCDERAMFGR